MKKEALHELEEIIYLTQNTNFNGMEAFSDWKKKWVKQVSAIYALDNRFEHELNEGLRNHIKSTLKYKLGQEIGDKLCEYSEFKHSTLPHIIFEYNGLIIRSDEDSN